MAHHQSVAFVGAQQGGEHGNGGGLAGAVGAEQAKDFARLDVETDALHGLDFAKGFVQVCYLNGYVIRVHRLH